MAITSFNCIPFSPLDLTFKRETGVKKHLLPLVKSFYLSLWRCFYLRSSLKANAWLVGFVSSRLLSLEKDFVVNKKENDHTSWTTYSNIPTTTHVGIFHTLIDLEIVK